MTEACERFMQDPEGERKHAETCAECAVVLADIERMETAFSDISLDTHSVAEDVVPRLPLAPWEGAAHRSWRLVGFVLAALVVGFGIAVLLAGASPLASVTQTAKLSFVTAIGAVKLAPALPRMLDAAPVALRVGLAISFVVINLALFFLLRRQPRGYDAPRR